MITIDLPGDLFVLQTEASIFTPDCIQRELANNPEATQLEVDKNEIDNDEIETVTTCQAMWLPNTYAALCLHKQLTPVDIWNRLFNTIVQNSHLEACSPLIRFLQYQLLGNNPDNLAAYQEGDLTQPNILPAFLRHCSEVLANLTAPITGTATSTNSGGTGGNVGLSAADLQALIPALRSGHTTPAPGASTGTSTLSNTIDK